ncbi:MAG: asparaginase [Thermoanaerobaculia bacterium]|nr:asparaginase [Thermoanaerobaculia bacterium]
MTVHDLVASSDRKSVYVCYTGGTIGMQKSRRGYIPEPGFLDEQMNAISVLQGRRMPRWVIHEFEPILDSSNMTPSDWIKVGEDIFTHYDDYDGFIVLHGTDTMSYTASALSFMLRGLRKPVVFTGSQIPLVEVRNDARENLITSLLLAAESRIPEVILYVGDTLLRGNRSTKVSAERFHAFESPNYPPLGHAGVDLQIYRDRLLHLPSEPLQLDRVGGARVADIRLYPGITPDLVRQFLAPPIDGAVMHTYGLGNAPDDPDFLAALREASDRGVVVVNCTQCLEGSVDMEGYATGSGLLDAGVLSGYDMTPEAALTKLYWLLSLRLPRTEVVRLMQTNVRGELTEPA